MVKLKDIDDLQLDMLLAIAESMILQSNIKMKSKKVSDKKD